MVKDLVDSRAPLCDAVGNGYGEGYGCMTWILDTTNKGTVLFFCCGYLAGNQTEWACSEPLYCNIIQKLISCVC